MTLDFLTCPYGLTYCTNTQCTNNDCEISPAMLKKLQRKFASHGIAISVADRSKDCRGFKPKGESKSSTL